MGPKIGSIRVRNGSDGTSPVCVGSRRLWSGASGQGRSVEDGRIVEGRRAGVVDGHRARLGVGDALRHDEDAAVDDDHDDERQVERADGRVELVADRLRQLAPTLQSPTGIQVQV